MKVETANVGDHSEWSAALENEPRRKVLRPSYFRYFHRGQNRKPTERDYLVKKFKKVKLEEFDKQLEKFRHKEASVAALTSKNPGKVFAVTEELVARKKLLRCVFNLEDEFLHKYTTKPRYAGLLTKLADKVVESRVEDIISEDQLRAHVRNLKRDMEEESEYNNLC